MLTFAMLVPSLHAGHAGSGSAMGGWQSPVSKDTNGQEWFSRLHVAEDSFVYSEYLRDRNLEVHPDVWVRRTHIMDSLDALPISFLYEPRCDQLLVTSDKGEEQPAYYFRYTDFEVVDNSELIDWDITPITEAQIGQWICAQGDIPDDRYDIWELSIADDRSFYLRLFLYDQVWLRNGWALGFEIIGTYSVENGDLLVNKAFKVQGDMLEEITDEGIVPFVRDEVLALRYEEACDRLIVLLPTARDSRMVLRFQR